jgi:hypothetical protein
MILFSQKIVNSRSIILCVGKAQGTINGREIDANLWWDAI